MVLLKRTTKPAKYIWNCVAQKSQTECKHNVAEVEKSAQQKQAQQWHHGHYKSIFKTIIGRNMQRNEKEVECDTKTLEICVRTANTVNSVYFLLICKETFLYFKC